MKQETWGKPLEIDFSPSGVVAISGPTEALNCLAHFWPDHRGPRYVAARSVCRAAIDGRKSLEQAREVFVTAVEEARLGRH